MRHELALIGPWDLHDEPIAIGADSEGTEHLRIAALPDDQWVATPVPGDIRQGLIAAGRAKDPVVGLGSYDNDWIEDRSWWLRRRFDVSKDELKSQVIELELEGLDVHASIYLNGVHLGDHPSAFRPFVARVKQQLRAGQNTLLLRLTHGLENINPKDALDLGGHIPMEAERGRPERNDVRRVYVRKMQCTWGWDWGPRAASVGITGGATLRFMNTLTIRGAHVLPKRREAKSKDVDLHVTAEVDWLDPFWTGSGRVDVAVRDGKKVVAKASAEVFFQGGVNFIKFTLPVRHAKLWWPTGYGEQHRYTVSVTAKSGGSGGVTARLPEFQYGIRFVEIRTNPQFHIRVNGQAIFAKGGNWVPQDSIYARVTDEKIETLVSEAKAANFNMLRVWGGGRYEPEAFYDACDRQGILVWHDFMLSCGPYPDHIEAFRDEVAKEADHQTRRLRNHPCIALWCGSNECLQFLTPGTPRETTHSTILTGHVFPRAVEHNCPDTPYWYCSPNTPTEFPPSLTHTDTHYWRLALVSDPVKRTTLELWDDCEAAFVSEYGYTGPPVRESVEQYLNGATLHRTDKTWVHHENSFERNSAGLGAEKEYLGPKSGPENLDDYLLYGGLWQGVALGYSLETLRHRPTCHGALFWMFNDCWGEVGWSVIDYYLRRKIAWWFVRRALAPRRLILRRTGKSIRVVLANDSPGKFAGTVEFGYVSLDGKARRPKRKRFTADAGARTTLATFARGGDDPTAGLWYARIVNEPAILPATLRAGPHRELRVVNPNLAVRTHGRSLTIASDVYAHAVHLQLPDGVVPEDNYFDLLPGESRTIGLSGPLKGGARVWARASSPGVDETRQFELIEKPAEALRQLPMPIPKVRRKTGRGSLSRRV